jgi:hypothetical protein
VTKLALVVCVVVSAFLAGPVRGQTTLTVNTHWADGTKCACTIVVKQLSANGSTTNVFQGVTDANGHLSALVDLQVTAAYSLSITSNAYGIPVFSLPFSTGLVSALTVKSATLNFVFTRPAVNGQPIACCILPTTYTPPALASGTGVEFGL